MSAVIPFLEARPNERKQNADVLNGLRAEVESMRVSDDFPLGLGGTKGKKKAKKEKKPTLDADGRVVNPLSKPHTELMRLLWARARIAQALVGAQFKLEVQGGDIMVVIEPAVRKDVIPWHHSGSPSRRFNLFSTNSKMRSPTFDLPAGVQELGGSCPGAAFAQSSVSQEMLKSNTSPGVDYGRVEEPGKVAFLVSEVAKDWEKAGEPAPDGLNLLTTVCEYCYATGSKYAEAVVQFAEIARLAFVKTLMATSEGTETLIKLLVRTIEDTLVFNAADTSRHGIRPIRVHSSGDFFSPAYADMWLEVARRLHQNAKDAKAAGIAYTPVMLWAPTRTHVLKGFNTFWQKRLDARLIPPNFSIRPSAYSVGDPAPYTNRPSPTGTKGTAVLFPDDAKRRIHKEGRAEFGDGKKLDFQCGVYALEKGNKTCLSSVAPDGKTGCRACWVRRDLAVGYVIH